MQLESAHENNRIEDTLLEAQSEFEDPAVKRPSFIEEAVWSDTPNNIKEYLVTVIDDQVRRIGENNNICFETLQKI